MSQQYSNPSMSDPSMSEVVKSCNEHLSAVVRSGMLRESDERSKLLKEARPRRAQLAVEARQSDKKAGLGGSKAPTDAYRAEGSKEVGAAPRCHSSSHLAG